MSNWNPLGIFIGIIFLMIGALSFFWGLLWVNLGGDGSPNFILGLVLFFIVALTLYGSKPSPSVSTNAPIYYPTLPTSTQKVQSKFENADEMRNNPTPAEERMWDILNSSVTPNFPEHVFYSQSLQYGYILDFYCPTLKLAIEVDGGSHNNRQGYDWERDSHLARWGIQVLRASNQEVFNNPQALADSLCKIIQEKNQQLNWKKRNSAMRYNRGGFYSPRRY